MNLKRKRISCLLFCCLAVSGSVFAAIPGQNTATMKKDHYRNGAISKKPHNHFEVLGALSISQLEAGSSNLGVTSSETDKLVQTNSDSWNAPGGQLGVGYIYNFQRAEKYYSKHKEKRVKWFTSIEPQVNLYQISSNSIKGDVWRFGSSAFNQMTYDIPVHSTRLMFDAALTVATYKRLSVYAKGGMGVAWNHVSYSDTDNDDAGTCSNQRVTLNSNTNTNFVWEAGIGLALAASDRIGFSLEYLYTDLGKVSPSGHGSTGTITTPILVAPHFNLNAQTALLGLHISLDKTPA